MVAVFNKIATIFCLTTQKILGAVVKQGNICYQGMKDTTIMTRRRHSIAPRVTDGSVILMKNKEKEAKKIQRPNEEALRRVLTAYKGRIEEIALRFAWTMGLTVGEMIDLTWNDVSFETSEVCLSDRNVPMDEEMQQCLQERFDQPKFREKEFIMTSDKRLRHTHRVNLTNYVRDALDTEEALRDISLTDLREDFVIRQLEQHDWSYVLRISGLSTRALYTTYGQYVQKGEHRKRGPGTREVSFNNTCKSLERKRNDSRRNKSNGKSLHSLRSRTILNSGTNTCKKNHCKEETDTYAQRRKKRGSKVGNVLKLVNVIYCNTENCTVGCDKRKVYTKRLMKCRYKLLKNNLNKLNERCDYKNEYDSLEIYKIILFKNKLLDRIGNRSSNHHYEGNRNTHTYCLVKLL